MLAAAEYTKLETVQPLVLPNESDSLPPPCRAGPPASARRVEVELVVPAGRGGHPLGGGGCDRQRAAAAAVEDQADDAAADVALEALAGAGADIDAAGRLHHQVGGLVGGELHLAQRAGGQLLAHLLAAGQGELDGAQRAAR